MVKIPLYKVISLLIFYNVEVHLGTVQSFKSIDLERIFVDHSNSSYCRVK